MRTLLLAVICAAAWAAEPSAAAEPTSTMVDRPIRFVNDRVITMGDLRYRSGMRIEMYRRAGKVLPDTRESTIAFYQDTLEELTDEELLIQKADEMQVAIDRDRLSNEVIAEARSKGLPLKDIAILRKIRERESKLDSILGWYESRVSSTGPEELDAAYRQHASEFTRPPRARTLLMALRPTPADERQQLVTALARLFRIAQQDADEAIRHAAISRLDAFLAADSAGQEVQLAAAAAEIAARTGAQGLGKASADLVGVAVGLQSRWRLVRDRDAAAARLEAIRTEIMNLPPVLRGARFRELATSESQGPHASDGGELGWVEPGTYGREIEEQALAMPVFETSPVFWSGGSAALVLVLERESGRTQTFAEVSGALSAGLDGQRRQQLRARVAKVLRSQASVRNVTELADMIR